MRKIWKCVLVSSLFSVLIMAVACGDGFFVGPIGGSQGGTPGLVPEVGLAPTDFIYEDPLITGFHTDVWYIDPGRDSNDGPGGVAPAPFYADSINTMVKAGFSGFASNPPVASPLTNEVNFTWPVMISYMSQWYRRNSDGLRVQSLDIFGNLVWSSSSLDICFVSGPVQLITRPGPQDYYEVFRWVHPFQSMGSSMQGWTSPTAASPGSFPAPQQAFATGRYSELGVVLPTALLGAGTPPITNALGVAITDGADNPQIENMGTIPQTLGGGFTPVPNPTGTFGYLFADDYRLAPVITPFSPGHTELEAMIEFTRHFGCLHAQLVALAIGLNSGEKDTIMDPEQVIWQNGYAYTFIQADLGDLANIHLPGRFRDPLNP